jgi:hypothetical protein
MDKFFQKKNSKKKSFFLKKKKNRQYQVKFVSLQDLRPVGMTLRGPCNWRCNLVAIPIPFAPWLEPWQEPIMASLPSRST